MEKENLLNREIELYKLGFKKNEHDYTFFHTYQYGHSWYIDFYSVYEPDEEFWQDYLKGLKSDLQEAKKDYYDDIKCSDGYKFREKEIKKKLKDEYNKYNSWLQQETQFKIGKGNPNLIRETELRAKVELLKELIEKL